MQRETNTSRILFLDSEIMKIITLTTDFGTSDYFVGAMKGAILAVNSNANLVDVTHEIPPHEVYSGAFTLFAAYKTFPPDSIHLIVVDPGVGSNRRAIIAVSEKYTFVAPDNGILSLIYRQEPKISVFEITNERFFRQPVSRTFHGRDIFAPIAGALSRGVMPSELGGRIVDFVRFETKRPRPVDENAIEAEILHIDRFGNCVTNIMPDDLPEDFFKHGFRLKINEHTITNHCEFYAEAAGKSEPFVIWGSAGFLEIVVFQNSAARRLKIKPEQDFVIKRN